MQPNLAEATLNALKNPADLYPKPPFKRQPQPAPGLASKMEPRPAPTYVLLASQEASYITGEVFGNVGGSAPY